MTKLWALLPLLALSVGPARAQGDEERLTAGEVLTVAVCEAMRDTVMKRIESYTRMKFRRPVPMRVEPKGVWENKIKASGYAGHSAKHALAYYTPGWNHVTVVPWVIGGYANEKPIKKPRGAWIAELEPTMIHELTHAIHHQNFYTEGRFYAASLRASGLSERDLDRSTVDFLMGEGVPELVSLRTTTFLEKMQRHPSRELQSAISYMRRYRADGKQPYRTKLSIYGYSDGLDLMHHLAKRAGPRGIRAVLYRPPPRVLLFQPEILATVDLDDPPEPDPIFQFLSPEILKGNEILRAVYPGAGRFFESAGGPRRTPGCLIGYVALVANPNGDGGRGRYAFFVADPDQPGSWIAEQAQSLKSLSPTGAKESSVGLAHLHTKGVKATVIEAKAEDGGLYVYAATGGLVVIVHESKPSPLLKRKVIGALEALSIKRPKAHLYDEATKRAIAKLAG